MDVLVDHRVIEIQTSNFGALNDKLPTLLESHHVTVVYPIAVEKMIVKVQESGEQRRKSPKTGSAMDLVDELVHMPSLLNDANLDLELIYTSVEERRIYDPKRAWRRRHWVVDEKRLVDIRSTERFTSMADLFKKLGARLPRQFTTKTIAQVLGTTRNRAQKFAYCFREADVIRACGKEGNALVYERAE